MRETTFPNKNSKEISPSPLRTKKNQVDQFDQLDNKNQLEERIKKLQYLCACYDPYNQSIPEDIHQLLLEFNLDPQEHNPFSLTKNLLVLLDQLTTLIQK